MKCNLGCEYCYEEPDRHHSQEAIQQGYSIDAIIDQLEDWYEDRPEQIPGLHGGEPLLLPKEDLREIYEWLDDHYDLDEHGSHIQTNATRISDWHIDFFEEFNIRVGVSFDGPEELNSLRKARSEKDDDGGDITDEMTKKTRDSIERLIESDVGVGIIIVLTEENAGNREKIEELYEWIDYLNRNGCGGHFNPAIPFEGIQDDVSLSPEQLKKVYLYGWEWMKEESYREWNPMREFQNNLLSLGLGNCVNNTCDVFNANAAQIVKGNGELTGCGKTWPTVGDGVSFLQGESSGNEFEETTERYKMLKQTPSPYTEDVPDEGGCKDCDYWNVCQGGCPSSGLEYDYRNRTLWCKAKYALYDAIEEDMRGMFPGIRTITELPWDFDFSELNVPRRKVDIKPFAGMRHSSSENPSVMGGPNESGGLSSIRAKAEPFDETVERYKEEYDSEILTIDPEQESVHADSARA
jgi:uncharacterized protein